MRVDSSLGNFKILITGDFVSPQKNGSNITRLEPLFSDLIPLFIEHSCVIANLETPLTKSGKPIRKVGPTLQSNPKYAKEINGLGINIVSLANNHIMDMGPSGLDDTLEALHQSGIQFVGAGRNLTEASTPLYIEYRDTTLAILALAEHEFSIAEDDRAGACPIDPIENYRQIKEAKKKCDLLVVILHGGNEYYSLPSPRMVDLCHYYVEIGADAVVCHHAHVPSGYENFKGAPIFYGLGNFFFQWLTPKPKDWYFGYMVSLDIAEKKIKSTTIIPYSQNYVENEGVKILHGMELAEWLERLAKISQWIADPKILNQKWQDFCEKQEKDYTNLFISRNRLESFLRSRWPILFYEKDGYFLLVRNLISCEAHREVLLQVLKNLVEK